MRTPICKNCIYWALIARGRKGDCSLHKIKTISGATCHEIKMKGANDEKN